MKKQNKKSLALSKETIRSLEENTLRGAAGGDGKPPPESWFLTVCAPCKSFPCGGGGGPLPQ